MKQVVSMSYEQSGGAPPRILIVDDDQILLQALPKTIWLRIPSSQIDTASSGQEALTYLQEQHYDAIVSDIKMPGMDGLSLLARVRELQLDTPTLLITGHGEHSLAVQALRGGAYDYIQKPIERDDFTAALLRAIQTCRLRRQVKEQQKSLELYARSLEQLVQQRTQELAEAHKTKDKIISLVSHELNEPITRLKSITQLLKQKLSSVGLSEIVAQSFDEIELSVKRTEELVQELLNTSNIETQRFILHRSHHDLLALCRTIFEEELSKVPVDLYYQPLLDGPIEVEVDGSQIRQVLSMLMSSIYLSATREEPVTITLQQTDQQALITIRDQGASASPGVDFYVAYKILEQHNGYLKVQGFPGKRRTHFIALPIRSNATAGSVSSLPRTYATWIITPGGASPGQIP